MSQPTTRQPHVIDWTSDKPYLPLLEGPPATCGMRSGRVELRQGEEIGEHSTGGLFPNLPLVPGSEQLGEIGGGTFERHAYKARPTSCDQAFLPLRLR